MDGNRGAKGSIKDRLISLLYRLRYAKKVKKEDEYTIAKKEKQVAYLKKLVELKETENINILDSNDRKELDNVKLNISVELNQNKKDYKINKKGINEIDNLKSIKLKPREIDINLKSIELKTNELDEKVELKDEIKKTKTEIVILEEVNNFVKKSKETLEEINNEVESLKQISKEKNQDTKELEERYKKLREKVEKLKAQYEAVKNKYDLSEFSILESIKLMDNIKDYKSKASLNEMDMMIKVCKKEIIKIESVTIEHQETKKIGTSINNTKEAQQKIKVRFNKSKEKVDSLKYTERDITEELDYQEKVIEEMYKEASYFEQLTRTDLVYKGYKGMLSSMLRIAGGILTLPFSGSKIFGVALGNAMINRGLKMMNKSFYPFEYETTITYHYKDIAHKISEVKDKVEYTNLLISDNLIEVKKLRENFKKYKEYNKVLPNYEEILDKVDKMEKRLKQQQEKITKMDKKLEEEKKINFKKMEKVINAKQNNKH